MNGRATPVARLDNVSHHYGAICALNAITLDVPSGRTVGLIGPDGVGKSSLLGIIAGSRRIQTGRVRVLDGDMADARHRHEACSRIAYMPQGLGKNLYPDLSVRENIEFFSRLFGQSRHEREWRIAELLDSTGLAPFPDRPAKKLSGGMRQKLGLCCALIHDPDLLILDEPTTGVDPLSRRQFWDLIERMHARRPEMSIIIATAYMEEAERFDWLIAMDGGTVLAQGSPADIESETNTRTIEAAFIALLPEQRRRGRSALRIPPRTPDDRQTVITATDLTFRFGDFTAVDGVSFSIERGEIFGFLGPNGCGKTTTMKMLTGLLPATAGKAFLLGEPIDATDLSARNRVGYMSQSFSLYTELTVRQNLILHARLFRLSPHRARSRIAELVQDFGLEPYLDQPTSALPLGIRQRLSLAVAIVHEPEILILDEPTSGVDPLARDHFWELLIDLSRNHDVTIFVSTHFMNEAARCDRISLMNEGRVLATDTPAALTKMRGAATLEDAFISYLEEANGAPAPPAGGPRIEAVRVDRAQGSAAIGRRPDRAAVLGLRRILAYSTRETLELLRDPIRLSFALLGTAFLMLIFGFGITTDVDNLSFAALDRDQTPESRAYLSEFRGSRYFVERAPIIDYADLERRLRSGDVKATIEIPPGFGRDLKKGTPVAVGAWIDGAMPFRAETIRGYLLGVHQQYLADPVLHHHQGPGSGPDRDHRDPIRLQPGFQERLRHGAIDARAAAGIDSCHPHGAVDRPRKGARLDHQLLRHAGERDRISDWEAASLHRRGPGQFRCDVADGAVCFPCSAEGQLPDARTRGAALRYDDDRLRHVDIFVYPHPDCRAVWHRHSDICARNAVLRHADPGLFLVRPRCDHWAHIPDDLFPGDQRRHFHQGTGVRVTSASI